METKDQRSDRPRVWPLLLLAAALAVWIDLGDFHLRQTSDSLVPVLTSLYRWTPYYWECNRLGMLVPFLALPFKSPFVNLLVQAGLVLFASFAGIFLLPAYVWRSANAALAGLLAAALFFLSLHKDWSFYFTFGQPAYPVGLALGLGALLLASRGRIVGALVLSLLAHWVNSATALFLGPLVVLRWLLTQVPGEGEKHRARRELVVLVAGWLVGTLLPRILLSYPADPVRAGLLPVSCWPASWAKLAVGTWMAVVAPRAAWYQALVVVATLGLLVPALRRQAVGPLRAAGALAGAGVVHALLIGTLRWVEMNEFHCRYWLPSVFLVHASLAVLATGLVAALLQGRSRRLAALACTAALALGISWTFGRPSLDRVRADLDHLPHNVPLAQRTADLLATRATHVAGPYAQVWVSVFHANLVLHERGEDRVIWGVTGRALATRDLWCRMPPQDVRLAVLPEVGEPDREAAAYRQGYFPPLTVVEQRATLALLRATQVVQPSAPH
jgi:hypothetical protein